MASRIKELTVLIADKESREKSLEASIINLSQDIETRNKLLSNINKDIDLCEKRLLEKQLLVDESEKKYNNIAIKYQDVCNKLCIQEEKVDEARKIIIGINKEIKQKNTLLTQVIILLNNVNLRVYDIETELDWYNASIKTKKSILIKLGTQIENIRGEIQKWQQSLKYIHKEYNDIKQKHDSLHKKIWEINRREKDIIIREKRYKKLRFNKKQNG